MNRPESDAFSYSHYSGHIDRPGKRIVVNYVGGDDRGEKSEFTSLLRSDTPEQPKIQFARARLAVKWRGRNDDNGAVATLQRVVATAAFKETSRNNSGGRVLSAQVFRAVDRLVFTEKHAVPGALV